MSASATLRLLVLGLVGGLCSCGSPSSPPHIVVPILTPSGRPFVGNPPVNERAILLVARRADGGDVRVLRDESLGGLGRSLPHRDERVELWAAGCLPEPVPWPLRAPVQLREGIRVRLRVMADGGLPAAPFHVGFRATWDGPGDVPEALLLGSAATAAPAGWLDASERYATVDPTLRVDAQHPIVDATFSRAGPHRLQLTVWESRGGGVRTGISPSDPGIPIEVQPERDGPPQEIEVRLDPAFLREATGQDQR